jgi:peptide deformylase
MSAYKILHYKDPLLRQVSKPVQKINAGIFRLLDNMKDSMYAQNGVGLAAPQIGVLKRVVVVDIGEGDLIELINPEIVAQEGEQFGKEGCLSVPNTVGWVRRSQKVTLTAWDREGNDRVYEAEDYLARAFQHEIDHLNGVLYVDLAEEIEDAEETEEE